MGANFDEACELMLRHEDATLAGTVTKDTGGVTKWGLSAKANPDLDIENLTLIEAKAVYHTRYWQSEYEQMCQPVANKVFDMAVNMGNREANMLLQCALHDVGYTSIGIDGDIGPKTMASLQAADAKAHDKVLKYLKVEQIMYYFHLCEKEPDKYSKYMRSWVSRGVD